MQKKKKIIVAQANGTKRRTRKVVKKGPMKKRGKGFTSTIKNLYNKENKPITNLSQKVLDSSLFKLGTQVVPYGDKIERVVRGVNSFGQKFGVGKIKRVRGKGGLKNNKN